MCALGCNYCFTNSATAPRPSRDISVERNIAPIYNYIQIKRKRFGICYLVTQNPIESHTHTTSRSLRSPMGWIIYFIYSEFKLVSLGRPPKWASFYCCHPGQTASGGGGVDAFSVFTASLESCCTPLVSPGKAKPKHNTTPKPENKAKWFNN